MKDEIVQIVPYKIEFFSKTHFEWTQLKEVQDKIPTLRIVKSIDDQKKYFIKNLKDRNIRIYLILYSNRQVGITKIRIHPGSRTAIFSIMIPISENRRQGVGTIVLKRIEEMLKADFLIKKIFAEVLMDNGSSQNFFKKNGYQITGESVSQGLKHFIYRKEIKK